MYIATKKYPPPLTFSNWIYYTDFFIIVKKGLVSQRT